MVIVVTGPDILVESVTKDAECVCIGLRAGGGDRCLTWPTKAGAWTNTSQQLATSHNLFINHCGIVFTAEQVSSKHDFLF